MSTSRLLFKSQILNIKRTSTLTHQFQHRKGSSHADDHHHQEPGGNFLDLKVFNWRAI